MQWLINEFKQFKDQVDQRIKDFGSKLPDSDFQVPARMKAAEEKIEKLEGEIRAMKARMGKKQVD